MECAVAVTSVRDMSHIQTYIQIANVIAEHDLDHTSRLGSCEQHQEIRLQ
jgi:hypothetical protein